MNKKGNIDLQSASTDSGSNFVSGYVTVSGTTGTPSYKVTDDGIQYKVTLNHVHQGEPEELIKIAKEAEKTKEFDSSDSQEKLLNELKEIRKTQQEVADKFSEESKAKTAQENEYSLSQALETFDKYKILNEYDNLLLELEGLRGKKHSKLKIHGSGIYDPPNRSKENEEMSDVARLLYNSLPDDKQGIEDDIKKICFIF